MVGTINFCDKEFPVLLKEISDCPKKLYYKGVPDSRIFDSCIAVVGSRRQSEYGTDVTSKLIREIASYGITVVSGFMYGIDSLAHEACLDVGGKTVAVLGYGINRRHASYNIGLAEKIIESGGLIISEYPDKFPADKWTFPRRNRIVAGLCKAVLVVEAAKNSGSLITANFAIKYNRGLFAVPGQINSIVSAGTNNLIKEGKAKMAVSGDDILKFYGFGVVEGPKDRSKLKNSNKRGQETFNKVNLDIVEKRRADIHSMVGEDATKIYDCIIIEPLSLNKICQKTSLSASDAGYFLTKLELMGFVGEKGGKYSV